MTLEEIKEKIESCSNVKVKYISRYLTTLECELNDDEYNYVGIMSVIKWHRSDFRVKFNFYHKITGKRIFKQAEFYYAPLKYDGTKYSVSMYNILSKTEYTDETKEKFEKVVHKYFPNELINYYGIILNGV